jgi:ABC-2 type transport system permease protein
VVFGGGVRELSNRVTNGELDSYLTLPKSPLLHLLASRTMPSGWGDMATGVVFLGMSGLATWRNWPLALVAITASTVVFVATGVLVHSLVFWLGRVEAVAWQAWDFLVTFSMYPRPLFSGVLKLVLFTLVPAAFVGWLPCELLRDFAWSDLALVVGSAAGWSTLAAWVFATGLRRYESGNAFLIKV